MKCEKCGTMNNEQDRFCNGCGSILNTAELNNTANVKPIEARKVETEDKDETKSALLSVLIGVGGILVYWFIGLRYTQAFIFGLAGFSLAGVGFKSNKPLSIIGFISNVIFLFSSLSE